MNTNVATLIEEHRTELAKVMCEEYRNCLENDGRFQVQIYIWDNGEIETNQVFGSNTWLVSNSDDCDLYHVCTIGFSVFNWQDFDPIGDATQEEVIDCLCDDFDPEPMLDQAIEDWSREE